MPMLEKWTPFRELDLMDRRMRRFFEDLGIVPVFAPAANAYETDDEFVIELEVPGFDEHELEVEVVDHTLRVKGEREEATRTEATSVQLHERLEKTFERRFQLPRDIDGEHVDAVYSKGLLTLRAPKTGLAKPRKVEIATK